MSDKLAPLKPFFCFYGGKWRAAPHYPQPTHEHIVEPFAGAAGYATRHSGRKVILVERDPIIAGLWRYLVRVRGAEVRRIPLLRAGQSVDDLRSIAPEARHLVGFWLNKGTNGPRKRPSMWMRDGLRPHSFWGEKIRERIASQVDHIRHWRIVEGDWVSAPHWLEATWFVDPPYCGKAGRAYVHNDVDYPALSRWCRRLVGQVVVCEGPGASWLPFGDLRSFKANESSRGGRVTIERIWTNSSS